MFYRHVFDKISTEFRRIFRVFVNFAVFQGFTWISQLRDCAKYQKPCYEQVLQGVLVAGWQKERACNDISGIWLSASKKSMQNDDWRDDISNDVITLSAYFHMFFHFLFIFALVLASRWLAEIWQLSFPEQLARKVRFDNAKIANLIVSHIIYLWHGPSQLLDRLTSWINISSKNWITTQEENNGEQKI